MGRPYRAVRKGNPSRHLKICTLDAFSSPDVVPPALAPGHRVAACTPSPAETVMPAGRKGGQSTTKQEREGKVSPQVPRAPGIAGCHQVLGGGAPSADCRNTPAQPGCGVTPVLAGGAPSGAS